MTTILLILSILLNVYFIFRWYKTFKTNQMEKQKELVLTFIKGRDGNIIAKTMEGKVCLIDTSYVKENGIIVLENEDWRCSVKEEKKACLIVQPINRITTAAENEAIYDKKINELKNKFAKAGSKAGGK